MAKNQVSHQFTTVVDGIEFTLSISSTAKVLRRLLRAQEDEVGSSELLGLFESQAMATFRQFGQLREQFAQNLMVSYIPVLQKVVKSSIAAAKSAHS